MNPFVARGERPHASVTSASDECVGNDTFEGVLIHNLFIREDERLVGTQNFHLF